MNENDDITEDNEPEKDNPGKIPMHRSFGLYVILICGIIVSFLGIYMQFSYNPENEHVLFDGESFQKSNIQPLVIVFAGLLICVFPLYHLLKGNHQSK